MPAYPWHLFRSETQAIILTSLPELTAIWEMDDAIRESWEKRTAPYMVTEHGAPDPGDEWGATLDAYVFSARYHYVAHETIESDGLLGIEAVEERVETLKSAFRVANQGVTGWPLSKVTLLSALPDTSRDSELNRLFYAKNIPFIGGCLHCRFVGGTTAT